MFKGSLSLPQQPAERPGFKRWLHIMAGRQGEGASEREREGERAREALAGTRGKGGGGGCLCGLETGMAGVAASASPLWIQFETCHWSVKTGRGEKDSAASPPALFISGSCAAFSLETRDSLSWRKQRKGGKELKAIKPSPPWHVLITGEGGKRDLQGLCRGCHSVAVGKSSS